MSPHETTRYDRPEENRVEAGLGLGTNVGDRVANLRQARELIDAECGLEVVAASAIYETEPVDVLPRFKDMLFLNAVLIVACSLDPGELSRRIHAIEDRMGRIRAGDRNAPRIMDIDILYVAGRVIENPHLVVPHPAWARRRFVVAPLADVRPGLLLPGQSLTVAGILSSLPLKPDVIRSNCAW
jgi:2-amino-4-hydroxy-6-hydroxymethyldihydropteridine diphosphokinase